MTIDRISPTLRPHDSVVMRQRWLTLLFLHWEVDPATVQALLPPGLTVDTYEGKTYVGLVPFTMRDVRPIWSPSINGISHFHECNVRVYVHHKGKDPGVWFFSLDAANPIAVAAARALFKLPYYFARMSLTKQDGTITYATERISPEPVRASSGGPVGCTAHYSPTGTPKTSTPGTLEHFLAERYILYAYDGKKLYSGRVHHTPYPLQTAKVHALTDTLVAAGGIILPDGAQEPCSPLAHYASGVDVDVFPLKAVPQ